MATIPGQGYPISYADPALSQYYNPEARPQAYRVPIRQVVDNTFVYPGFGRDPDLSPPPPAAAPPPPAPAPAPPPAAAPPPTSAGGRGNFFERDRERRSFTDPNQERMDSGMARQAAPVSPFAGNEVYSYPGQYDVAGVSTGTAFDTWGRSYDGLNVDYGELAGSLAGGLLGGPALGLAGEYLGGELTAPGDDLFVGSTTPDDNTRYVNEILSGAVPASDNEIYQAQQFADRMIAEGKWVQNSQGLYGPNVAAPGRRPGVPPAPPNPGTLTPANQIVGGQRTSGGERPSLVGEQDLTRQHQFTRSSGWVTLPDGSQVALPSSRPPAPQTQVAPAATRGAAAPNAPGRRPTPPSTTQPIAGQRPTGPTAQVKGAAPKTQVKNEAPSKTAVRGGAGRTVTLPDGSVVPVPGSRPAGIAKGGKTASATFRGGTLEPGQFRDENEARAAKAAKTASGYSAGGLKMDREGRSDREQAARDEKASRGDTSGGMK